MTETENIYEMKKIYRQIELILAISHRLQT